MSLFDKESNPKIDENTTPEHRPILAFVDTETFFSDVYSSYDSINFFQSDIGNVRGTGTSWRAPLIDVPDDVKNNLPFYCDHGGLVMGCALNSTKNIPIDMHMVMGKYLKSSEERSNYEQRYLTEKKRVVSDDNAQWIGDSGWNVGENNNFQTFNVLREYLKHERPDCISASLCFVNLGYAGANDINTQNDSLARDEVERNYRFYMLKKDPKLKSEYEKVLSGFQPKKDSGTLTNEENIVFQGIKNLEQLLTEYVLTFKSVSQNMSNKNEPFKVEDVIKDNRTQSVLKRLEQSFSALMQVDSKTLREYADSSLDCIKNLERVNINGCDTIRCLYNTSEYRKNRIEATRQTSKEFKRLLQECDDKNIAVFSVDALYHHYGFFVHGLEGNTTTDNQPKEHCVDDRLIVLSPKDTALFFSSFSKLDRVPSSYEGRNAVFDSKDNTGISGIIPQLSGTFIRARMIDSDVRPQEFLDILRRSGSISLTQRDNGSVFGGVIPNLETLEQNVQKWKEMRSEITPYAQASQSQRQERAEQFKQYLNVLDKQNMTISYFGRQQSQSAQEGSIIALQKTENTTYGEFLSRDNIMENTQKTKNTTYRDYFKRCSNTVGNEENTENKLNFPRKRHLSR